MKPLQLGLAAVLVVQIGLSTILFSQTGSEVKQQDELLGGVDLAAVERIVLEDDQDRELVIEKQADSWILPAYHQLPAKKPALEQALDKLAAITLGWPVAETDSARQRFEVAEDDYQRKLSLHSAEGTLATIYLGSSPSYQQVHLRRDGEDAIYAVGLNNYELSAQPERWFDQTLIQPENISRIEGDDFLLKLEGEQWLSENGDELDDSRVKALVNNLRQLTVDAVEPKTVEQPEGFRLRVGDGSDVRNWYFYQQGEQFWVEFDDDSLRYRIPKYRYQQLEGVDAQMIVKRPEAANSEVGKQTSEQPTS